MTTPVEVVFDEYTLEQTAQALLVINPSWAGHTVETLSRYIVSATRREIEKGVRTYWGTSGFYVSVTKNSDGAYLCHTTLMSFAVLSYIKRMEKETLDGETKKE